MAAAAVLAVVLLLGGSARPASALPGRPFGRSASGPPSVLQQDPEGSTSTTAAGVTSTTVQRSGDPVSDTQDAQVGVIVVALVIVALLLTICFLVFWRMTKPIPVPVVAPAGARRADGPTTSVAARSSGGKRSGSSSRKRSSGRRRPR